MCSAQQLQEGNKPTAGTNKQEKMGNLHKQTNVRNAWYSTWCQSSSVGGQHYFLANYHIQFRNADNDHHGKIQTRVHKWALILIPRTSFECFEKNYLFIYRYFYIIMSLLSRGLNFILIFI